MVRLNWTSTLPVLFSLISAAVTILGFPCILISLLNWKGNNYIPWDKSNQRTLNSRIHRVSSMGKWRKCQIRRHRSSYIWNQAKMQQHSSIFGQQICIIWWSELTNGVFHYDSLWSVEWSPWTLYQGNVP